MLGREGAGILQMNGQPTAQNTRETGADGDLPGSRNWANPEHVGQLAELWNLEVSKIPHYAPPTHAMEIFRQCEKGTIKLLWISGTNPAVSLPELHRIRAILGRENLFVVVQDLFLTETAALADIVLPAATQGEKTGCFTNADRTVHLSEKAIEPPGEARPDLDIFLDYARRMGFTDKDGAPLIPWGDAASALDAWADCSKGRPCDYSGLSHARLRSEPSGVQVAVQRGASRWRRAPLRRRHLPGRPGLLRDLRARPDQGRQRGAGRVPGLQPGRQSDDQGCRVLRCGRDATRRVPLRPDHGGTIYHFHTRTKTARAPELHAAAPDVWVEMHAADADRLGFADGERVEVVSPRGRIEGPLRFKQGRPGVVFVPFHCGYWDTRPGADGPGEDPPGANEMTITQWDPLSKQPIFKTAACNVRRAGS